MNILYAPWRKKYIKKKNITGCVFCNIIQKDESSEFILYETKHSCVLMNLYPYTAGHILVLPKIHKSELYLLPQQHQHELISLLAHTNNILKKSMNAEGINMGLNLGKAAGAGVPKHLHFHVLPRWQGDINFLPLVAQTKQVSLNMQEIYEILLPEFSKIVL